MKQVIAETVLTDYKFKHIETISGQVRKIKGLSCSIMP